MKRAALVLSTLGVLVVAACSGGGGGGTPEQQFIRAVATAMGGVSAVQSLNTVEFESGVEGDGESYWLGENRNPDADLPVFRTLSRWAFDWQNGRYRKEELKIAQFVSSNDQMRQTTTGLDGDIAYDVGTDMKTVRQPDDSARQRRLELRMHPVGLIRAALDPSAKIGPVETSGGSQSTDITLQDGSVLRLIVDSTTKLPSKISAKVSHPILGDVVQEVEFGDYGKQGGVEMPANFVTKLDGKAVNKFRAVSFKTNFDPAAPMPDAGHQAFSKNVRFEIPPIVKKQTAEPRASFLGNENIASKPAELEEASPGVWFVKGGDYYSALIEFDDHLTLYDAPIDDARFDSIVAKAKELRPNKPVTELIISHHHFDHLGGVRAAIAAGLTLYVRGSAPSSSMSPEMGRAAPSSLRSATSFYEDLASRPHTIVPDALQKAPKAPVIKEVSDKLVLSDKSRTLELYPVNGSEYADTLLMAYLPKEKLLMESDVFTPPNDVYNTLMLYPFGQNLLDNITSRKLNVERIIPSHGRIVPLDQLQKAITAKPASTAPPDPSGSGI